MPETTTIAAVLGGICLIPLIGEQGSNQRQNASGSLGALLLAVALWAQMAPTSADSYPNFAFVGLSLLSALLFALAYVYRRVDQQINRKQRVLAPLAINVVGTTLGACVQQFETVLIMSVAQAASLCWLMLAYRGASIAKRVKGYALVALYVLSTFLVHLHLNGLVISEAMPALTEGMLYALLAGTYLNLLVQSAVIKSVQKTSQGQSLEAAAMQVAYRGRRVLKDFRHDLRQPLSTLGILASVGRAIAKDPEVSARYQHIQTAQKALKTMLEEFFDQMEEAVQYPFDDQHAPLRPVKAHDVLAPLVEEYRLLAQSKDLQLRYVENDLSINTHLESLTKILRNGLDNAVKYTEHGGVVVGARRRGNRVLIQIVDTGPGVSTDPSHQRNKGWGHGSRIVQDLSDRILAMTRCVNRVIGGQVRGSIFEVSLPGTQDYDRADAKQQMHRDQQPLWAYVYSGSHALALQVEKQFPDSGFDQLHKSCMTLIRNELPGIPMQVTPVLIAITENDQQQHQAIREFNRARLVCKLEPFCILVSATDQLPQGKAIDFNGPIIRVHYVNGQLEGAMKVLAELFPARKSKELERGHERRPELDEPLAINAATE